MTRNDLFSRILVFGWLFVIAETTDLALGKEAQSAMQNGSNPYAELDRLAASSDLKEATHLYQLVRESYRLGLYGTSRQWARKVLQIDSDHANARQYLGYRRKVLPRGNSVWKENFELQLEAQGLVRHPKLGWLRRDDYQAADEGQIREGHELLTMAEADARHQTWATARIIESRYFRIRSTAPIEVLWFIAQDLDRLVTAYLDYFEIVGEPTTKPLAHLYRTRDDAESANARKDWLDRYGAYYQQSILHVRFQSLGGLTAIRHEAAHALNRAFMSEIPQWLDEGIGVFCQFAQPEGDGSFRFGCLPPKHAFGKRYLERVHAGHKETLREAISEPHVEMDSDHYSKFRALVDFFMNSADRKYRKLFIDTVFRKRGRIRDLAELPNIDEEWILYMKSLEPDRNWKYLDQSVEIEAIRQTLAN